MSMQAATFSGSLLNAATDQPPVPVAVWPALDPGSSDTCHLSNALPSCSFIVGHWHESPRKMPTEPLCAAVDISSYVLNVVTRLGVTPVSTVLRRNLKTFSRSRPLAPWANTGLPLLSSSCPPCIQK